MPGDSREHSLVAAALPMVVPSDPIDSESGGNVEASAPTRIVIRHGEVRIEVLAQGQGPRVVLLPSLGRGASDFDPISEWLAGAGFRVLRPQPRGIGQSRGPMTGIDLHTYAADVAAVIEQDGDGPAFVVGHAFGNRVARMLAVDRPYLVRAVALVAANVGHAPSPPAIRDAIKASANLSLPETERVRALQFAFFAPGNDPRPWLTGWYPAVLAAQRIAGDRTSPGQHRAHHGPCRCCAGVPAGTARWWAKALCHASWECRAR